MLLRVTQLTPNGGKCTKPCPLSCSNSVASPRRWIPELESGEGLPRTTPLIFLTPIGKSRSLIQDATVLWVLLSRDISETKLKLAHAYCGCGQQIFVRSSLFSLLHSRFQILELLLMIC